MEKKDRGIMNTMTQDLQEMNYDASMKAAAHNAYEYLKSANVPGYIPRTVTTEDVLKQITASKEYGETKP